VLDISECRHFSSDVLCQVWRDCTKLHTLHARGCAGVTDVFLQCVASTKRPGNSPGLRSLDICHCKNVTSSGISHLASTSLKSMAMLSLRVGDCLDVDSMAFFGFETSHCLANLLSLDLSGLRIDETGISWIAKGCMQLQSLNLSRCRLLNDFALLLLAPLLSGRLGDLNVQDCVLLTDLGFVNLFSLETNKALKWGNDDELPPVALERLNLKGCHLVGDGALRLLGRHANKLQKLNLRGLRKVSDTGVLAIAKGCAELASIKISGRNITDQTFKVLGKICPHLARLDISERLDLQTPECMVSLTSGVPPDRLVKLYFSATNICDVGVSVLATSCPQLRRIDLSKCARVTDISVEALAYCCHSLQVLLLSNTRAVTDRALVACAVMHLPLQCLDLCGNTNITDAGIQALTAACQQLHELRLKGCDRLSFQTLNQASRWLPFTRTPMPPSLSQTLATGGGNTSAMLHPLPLNHIRLVRHLVTQYEAACVLQARFRHLKQHEQSALILARRKHQRRTRAARKIQRCIRRFLSWRRYLRHLQLEQNRGVVAYIQAHVRGNQSRYRTRVHRFTWSRAAKQIQRCYQPHFAVRMKVRHANAVVIQRVYRGFRGRRAFQQALMERATASARKIWVWYRRCRHQRDARVRAQWLVKKIHNIQGQWRKYQRNQRLKYYLGFYRHRATLIQTIWRGFLTRHHVAQLRVVWSASATSIQRMYRSHRIRRIVHTYRVRAIHHATVIQKYWRRFAGQRRYRRHRHLITQMQRMARYARAVRSFRRVVDAAVFRHCNQAAFLIQRVYRGHLGRRRARLFRKIRHAVYAKKGQNASQAWRRHSFLRRGAAIHLQRFVRRYLARRRMVKLRKWRRMVSARCLQRYLKDWIRRVHLKRRREAQTHAAIAVQRVYRGHLGRLTYKQEKHEQDSLRSARLVQRIYRGYKGRCLFQQRHLEMTRAARMLQRAFRGRNTRILYEIGQAATALKAKEKYEKSILGMINAVRNPMDELYRRARLPHEKDALQKLQDKWHANRIAEERAVRKLTRELSTQVWPSTQETIANHLALRSRLYGVTENVYVTHRETTHREQRHEQLREELTDLHIRITQCKQALRDAVASRRMLDGKEILEIMASNGLLAPADNQLDG
jgi:hypothetical protein